MSNNALTVVQISDCHLFSDSSACYQQANVYENLCRVLNHIQQFTTADIVVFSGDLTQDHSQASYQLFVQAFTETAFALPVYYLAGNHDDTALLQRYLDEVPFRSNKSIDSANWQIFLLNSKSETPAGWVYKNELDQLAEQIDENKAQLLIMHHHPIDLGYFIDKHGLKNKETLYSFLEQYPSIQAMACGHVHHAVTLPILLPKRSVSLYTCPSTSVQFDVNSKINMRTTLQTAGYRVFKLLADKRVSSKVVYI